MARGKKKGRAAVKLNATAKSFPKNGNTAARPVGHFKSGK